MREHTAQMRPPRALWVSFELGRPFGAPHDAALQTRVLAAALALLERTDGPAVLDDFPEDAPAATPEEMEGMVCPVPLPRVRPPGGEAGHVAAVQAEIAALAPWHELAIARRGASTVGVSGLDLPAILTFLGGWLAGGSPPSPAGKPAALSLRLATEDFRNWYLEAASARPGGLASAQAMADWFWGDTAAGAMLLALQVACARSADPAVRGFAARALVPRTQMHRLDRLTTAP